MRNIKQNKKEKGKLFYQMFNRTHGYNIKDTYKASYCDMCLEGIRISIFTDYTYISKYEIDDLIYISKITKDKGLHSIKYKL